MSEDIETIVLDKTRTSKQFCLQLDEYTDIGKTLNYWPTWVLWNWTEMLLARSCRFSVLYKSGVS